LIDILRDRRGFQPAAVTVSAVSTATGSRRVAMPDILAGQPLDLAQAFRPAPSLFTSW